MQSESRVAFKEWAVVCAALAQGRQSIIVRKGGIHEGRSGFRVAHGEFWLLPTYLHQAAENLASDARPLLAEVLRQSPEEGRLRLAQYAVVEDVFQVRSLPLLESLAAEHVLAADTIRQRFEYRTPGLFVLCVRVYRAAAPWDIASTPGIAGCRSWVELPVALPTAGLEPVLDQAEFQRRQAAVRAALSAGSS